MSRFFISNLCYCFLWVCLLNPHKTNAQDGFTISPSSFEESYLNVDIADPWQTFPIKAFMGNNAADTLQVRWTKIISSNCVEEWEFFVSDINQGHLPTVITSPNPVQLLPNDSNKVFNINLRPKTVSGCCELKFIFSDFHDPTIVFDTVEYSIKINDEFCSTTNTKDQVFKKNVFEIFPNPSSSHFFIKSRQSFDKIIFYDFLGDKIKEIKNKTNNSFDISSLDSGIYLIAIFKETKLIGTSKLNKL